MFTNLTDLYFIDQHKPLGQGGFSSVQKVLNLNDQQIYALKEVDIPSLS